MTSDLSRFGLTEMLRCSQGVRQSTDGTPSLEAAARSICQYLRDEFVGGEESPGPSAQDDGGRQCALVRFYVTLPYGSLGLPLRRFADGILGDRKPSDTLRCLCLMGTAGSEVAWNERRRSRGHRAIPLPTTDFIEKAPMIAQLVRQFGLDLEAVVSPSPGFMPDLLGKSYGVFHVEDAPGSPYIPAQAEFVEPHGIQSVVGFGGALRNGDIFAVIIFSRTRISREVADRFRTLALDVKSALFYVPDEAIFDDEPPPDVRPLSVQQRQG